ncbi:glycoside hydrolase family 18 protein [Moniliophthora roreri]|nr:glycoside hydrolase family 18 protein [Moniliophthora roreri]
MFGLRPTTLLLISTLSSIIPVLSAQCKAGATVASAHYPGWRSDDFPPSKLSWSKYTHLTYAFAKTTSDNQLTLEGSEPSGLAPFVKAAHENNVKAQVGIGGWTGSQFFSTAVASQNRTAFVNTVVAFAKKYDLDGLEFGIGCNTISPDDTANFLAFLKELRANPVGAKLQLSASGSLAVWNDASGNPSSNVAGFADVLDYIAIMAYDVWGPWSSAVGPNAPLNDTCAAPANQQGSAVWSVDKWASAGIPRNKIVLAVPAYGHGYIVKKEDAFQKNSDQKLTKYPPFDKNNRPQGDRWDDPAGVDQCGTQNPAGGTFTFTGLVEEGYLNKDGSPKLPYRFDSCSKTAYVYNPDKQVMVSFDDANTFDHKGHFIKNSGLAGFSIWQAAGDYNDILLDSIRKAAGFKDKN